MPDCCVEHIKQSEVVIQFVTVPFILTIILNQIQKSLEAWPMDSSWSRRLNRSLPVMLPRTRSNLSYRSRLGLPLCGCCPACCIQNIRIIATISAAMTTCSLVDLRWHRCRRRRSPSVCDLIFTELQDRSTFVITRFVKID
jgi:hypothetical protein